MPFPLLNRFQKSGSASPPNAEAPQGLGTFAGVYTPSVLTILGVIMYLRFGWVVGNVGLFNTLLIVTLSTAITLLTSLSISAIATDQTVRVGGAYYMISRSLGIETGGAVGIPLFFAQAFSVALYTLGFAESLTQAFPSLNQTLVALVTTTILGLLALRSLDIAMKAQYVIMAAILLSFVSLAFGKPLEGVEINPLGAPLANAADFWTVFAVFFPAVTGIMAGVNLSGDLKDPKKSIPTGTLAAVGTGYVVYMVLPVLLAFRCDFVTLTQDPLVMRRISVWGDAIFLGVWGATLSSAIGSILGAPRVLQALARDGVLPRSLRWLGQGSGENDIPKWGTLFTMGLALTLVLLGDINLIAPILSMFFLTTYMVLNMAAAIEGFVRSPSFRPTFKVSWVFSLAGAIGCIGVMFLINGFATLVAAVVSLLIYLWLERREIESAWGDVRQGMWMTLVRIGLFNLNRVPDVKNWRPHLLVLSGVPSRRWHLVEFASSLSHNRGLVTIASVLPTGARDSNQQVTMEAMFHDYLQRRGTRALVRLVQGQDFFEGAERLVEAYGLGTLVPNTILLGSTDEPDTRDRYCQMIANFHQLQRNVVVLRYQAPQPRNLRLRSRIDVWWGGRKNNGGLMLIVADLLRTGQEWRNSEVWLKLVAPNQTAAAATRANMVEVLKRLRIDAVVEVLVSDGQPFNKILKSSSKTADLVILGMATPDENFSQYYAEQQESTSGLPTTLFVLASEDLAFIEVLDKD
ncbi:MAG: Na-K-Cl cotransporter [Thermosynechococcaceae cyanobacterium]